LKTSHPLSGIYPGGYIGQFNCNLACSHRKSIGEEIRQWSYDQSTASASSYYDMSFASRLSVSNYGSIEQAQCTALGIIPNADPSVSGFGGLGSVDLQHGSLGKSEHGLSINIAALLAGSPLESPLSEESVTSTASTMLSPLLSSPAVGRVSIITMHVIEVLHRGLLK
jgi:hypothetical protein